jgi:hypothetical protein
MSRLSWRNHLITHLPHVSVASDVFLKSCGYQLVLYQDISARDILYLATFKRMRECLVVSWWKAWPSYNPESFLKGLDLEYFLCHVYLHCARWPT